ncbi:MAG: hypothetical protein NTX76_00270 [Alphaproteobacteria bacterium]|nr:hypothetical protein [Alphaproteobacteria bacterium]
MFSSVRSVHPLILSFFAGFLTLFLALGPAYIPLVGFFLGYFSSLPLFLMSFGWGIQSGFTAGASAFLLFLLILGPPAAISFAIVTLVPFALLSYLFLTQKKDTDDNQNSFCYPICLMPSYLAGTFLIVTGVAIFGFYLWGGADLRQSVAHQLEQFIPPNLPMEKGFIENLIDLIPSFFFLSLLAVNVANAWVAEKILVTHKMAIRSVTEGDLVFSRVWDTVVVGGGLIILLGRYWPMPHLIVIAKTMVVVGCVPLFILGLRICYLVYPKTKQGSMWFNLTILLAFVLVWPLLVIVLLGFIEPCYGLTRRLTQK